MSKNVISSQALLIKQEKERKDLIKKDEKLAYEWHKIFNRAIQIKKQAEEIISEIKGKSIPKKSETTEIAKLNRHKVSPEHRVVKAIEKWKIDAIKRNDQDFLKNLDSMTVIAEDELQLIDGTVVKLGYPDIKADNKEIFEQIVKDTEDKEIRAIYFKNGKAFEKYQEEMKQKGFRIAGNENDISGKIAKQENQKIFDMIVKEGTPNYNTIIVDILGRAFSGFCVSDGVFGDKGDGELFWSCSPSPDRDGARYCYLSRILGSTLFGNNGHNYGFFGALFFNDKKSD